jgi:hypothetical protein
MNDNPEYDKLVEAHRQALADNFTEAERDGCNIGWGSGVGYITTKVYDYGSDRIRIPELARTNITKIGTKTYEIPNDREGLLHRFRR